MLQMRINLVAKLHKLFEVTRKNVRKTYENVCAHSFVIRCFSGSSKIEFLRYFWGFVSILFSLLRKSLYICSYKRSWVIRYGENRK